MNKLTRQTTSIRPIAMALALIGVACGQTAEGGSQTPALPDEVAIGATLPLTGSGAPWGASISQAMELAVEEINANGGVNGSTLDLAIEDHRAEAQLGASAFRKLAEVDDLPAIVSVNSGPVLAQIPIAQQTQTLLFDSGTVSPEVREAGEYVFSNVPKADDEAAEQARFVVEDLKHTKVAILSRQDEAGTNFTQSLKQALEEQGAEVVFESAHQPDVTDFRAALTRLERSGAKVTFLPTYINEATSLLRQAVQLDIEMTWVTFSTAMNAAFLEQLGNVAEDITLYASTLGWDPSYTSGPTGKFIESYSAAYGEEPEFYGANAYDAVYVISLAMESCDCYDAAGIAEGLMGLEPFDGVTGKTSFDEDGMTLKPILWFKVASDGTLERQE